MQQILQSLKTGETKLVDVPAPAVNAHGLVVESRASVISPGTERMLVEFGRGSLLDKARQQPERVKEVLQKVRTDGLGSTLEAVQAKLGQPIPLGYCNAGVVRDVGTKVEGFRPGDRVVTNGPHSEVVRVPWTLAARIPDSVSFETAAFAPLAAIGLQGYRLARLSLGERVVVYGLGLIGLLTIQIARAGGCRVIGVDRVGERLELAERFGAEPLEAAPDTDLPAAVKRLTEGVGADAVLLTLATDSDEPVRLAAEMSRKRGRLVLVGVTGLGLRRGDFYEKELSLQVSCSYGPGRYDPDHEEGGQDYPLPYVRWTEGRNFSAALQLMADGRLDPGPLLSHRIPFAEAKRAYETLVKDGSALGVLLEYPERPGPGKQVERRVRIAHGGTSNAGGSQAGKGIVGFIGAGNFATRVLMPAFKRAGAELHTVVSSGGTSAAVAARKHGFQHASTDLADVFENPEIDTVVIATRHDTHAPFAARALRSGKHVFVEKPLAITAEGLRDVEAAMAEHPGLVLCVGFNRRFAPLTQRAKKALKGRSGPLVLNITVNAGKLPDDHWTKDPQVGGGRLVGEACHFVDLARHLVGHSIRNLMVASASDPEERRIEDISLLQLSFDDGSLATVQYLANGPKGFPKERVEAFWDGKALRIDNWRRMKGWGVEGASLGLLSSQDKGHSPLVTAFLEGVRGAGGGPIPTREFSEVGGWLVGALQ